MSILFIFVMHIYVVSLIGIICILFDFKKNKTLSREIFMTMTLNVLWEYSGRNEVRVKGTKKKTEVVRDEWGSLLGAGL